MTALKYALLVSQWSYGHFLKQTDPIISEQHYKSSLFNSAHNVVLYPQNGDRIVTIGSVTSFHPTYKQNGTQRTYRAVHGRVCRCWRWTDSWRSSASAPRACRVVETDLRASRSDYHCINQHTAGFTVQRKLKPVAAVMLATGRIAPAVCCWLCPAGAKTARVRCSRGVGHAYPKCTPSSG